ncbi:hypothetical protein [Vibrio anguillarum]|uniref:hypothetical protein n=1 Tax=Vibrio anguillarum TaxID=55601 RepID=UPI001F1C2539|nr:hypothetical protein [Vibrio anguillarum]
MAYVLLIHIDATSKLDACGTHNDRRWQKSIMNRFHITHYNTLTHYISLTD